MAETIRVGRKELTTEEILRELHRGNRVIVEVEMLGKTLNMAIRRRWCRIRRARAGVEPVRLSRCRTGEPSPFHTGWITDSCRRPYRYRFGSAANLMSDHLQAFAEWAAALTIDDVPPDVLERSKEQVASTLGAAYGGLNGDAGRLVTALEAGSPPRDGDGSDGAHAVVGASTPSATAETACARNAAASIYDDYDDYCFMGHTGHSAVFASLAACEASGGEGADLLRGVVIATELEGRLGASAAIGPLNGQLWSFVHQAGAAAVWTVLHGGTALQVREAVRLALGIPPRHLEAGLVGGDSKALVAGAPAATGIRSGRLAFDGARGSRAAFDGPDGFLETFATLPIPEMLTGFGDAWVSRSLAIKPRPGCAYQQAPVEAVGRVVDRRAIDPDAVRAVRVEASLPTVAMEALSRRHQGRRLPPVSVPFSVSHGVAATLVGDYDPDGLTRDSLAADRASREALAGRVTVEHDWFRTVDLLDGLTAGVDFGALITDRGIARTLAGLVGMGRARPGVSAGREVRRLLGAGEAMALVDALRSPPSWPTFDLSQASFADVEFRFGCSVRVETDRGDYEASVRAHRGARHEPAADRGAVAYEKLEREYGDQRDREPPVDVIQQLESERLDALVKRL